MSYNPKTIHDLPKNDRPREKLIGRGARSLTDFELLAIILRTGIKGVSAIELSQFIIEKFNGFNGISNIFPNSYLRLKAWA